MIQPLISPPIMQRIQEWLDGPYDAETKKEIKTLLKTDPKALSDAFFKDISFGTGGMRGVMGVGTNRINLYTIRNATQGLSSYIKKNTKGPWAVFIGYDVRHNSELLAKEAARVLAGNGIRVFLTERICPTPLVSFGCRHFLCHAAIMITASHNPPEYNGYKVYWSDGAQVVPPHDQGIMKEVHDPQKRIHVSSFPSALIQIVGKEFETVYLQKIKHLQIYPEIANDDLKIFYSPLHGTGVHVLPEALRSWGYTNVHLIAKQSTPDGSFSYAPKPNPEEKETLSLGTAEMLEEKGDIFIATDPDADRIGVVETGPYFFSGNQIACLLLHHICEGFQKKKKPPHATCVKSIVTTEMFKEICESYGVLCVDVLTGFKFIGEKIALWEKKPEKHHYVFGAEESCGYLFGTDVRDKDAISTACLMAEVAALAKTEKMTLRDRLFYLYQKYGVHRERLLNFAFSDTPEGVQQMKKITHAFRHNPPAVIGEIKVMQTEDFLPGFKDFPPSDVVRLWLEDKSKLVIRPSGTEPKLKIYLEVISHTKDEIPKQIQHCEERLNVFTEFFKDLCMGQK